ncbi:unnamed protein product [Arctogadus glacialis]
MAPSYRSGLIGEGTVVTHLDHVEYSVTVDLSPPSLTQGQSKEGVLMGSAGLKRAVADYPLLAGSVNFRAKKSKLIGGKELLPFQNTTPALLAPMNEKKKQNRAALQKAEKMSHKSHWRQ